MLTRGALERLDVELGVRARREAALLLRLGQVLEVAARGACFELGFSSLRAYARERTGRGSRWVEGARGLARRLEALPLVRRALASGEISWSAAELVARAATSQAVPEARAVTADGVGPARDGPEERLAEARAGERAARELEHAWLALARRLSVRQLRELVRRERSGDPSSGEGALEAEADVRTLTCSVGREDAWLFEATRLLLEALGARRPCDQVEALLAEGQQLLLEAAPNEVPEACGDEGASEAQRHGQQRRARWREEAEARCEARVLASRLADGPGGCSAHGARRAAIHARASAAAGRGLSSLEGWSPGQLDAVARELSAALSSHELEFSQLLLRFHREDGFRRLGYASERQYARERLGMSRSSVLARRGLARRLEYLPELTQAWGRGEFGLETASQLVRVVTPRTQTAWIERARRRTRKHLREEVQASLAAVRLSGQLDCPPPLDAEIEAFHELERAALRGGAWWGSRVDAGEAESSVARGAPGESLPRGEGAHRVADGVDDLESASREREPKHEAAFPGGLAVSASRSGGERVAWRVALESLTTWLAEAFDPRYGEGAEVGAEGTSVQTSAGVDARSAVRRGIPRVGDRAEAAPAGGAAAAGVQKSAGGRSANPGRVRLRMRIDASLRAWWRGLERVARRHLPRGVGFLRFLCTSIWNAWRHLPGVGVAYGGIYRRDRYRCTSPVCERRDVTPHHLRFRSAGGGDEPDNLASLCSWCHLAGIHEGRIRAIGRAGRIRWELGRGRPCLVVEGRDKRVAA